MRGKVPGSALPLESAELAGLAGPVEVEREDLRVVRELLAGKQSSQEKIAGSFRRMAGDLSSLSFRSLPQVEAEI